MVMFGESGRRVAKTIPSARLAKVEGYDADQQENYKKGLTLVEEETR